MDTTRTIVEGYAKEVADGWVATATTTLITSNSKNILVDPGINRELLLTNLESNGFGVSDLDYVFLTHYHPDHALLAPLFEQALILDGDTIYDKDKETSYEGFIPETNVRVIPTPGHAHEHASPIVETKKGTVVIAADVFWWFDGEEQNLKYDNLLNKTDPFTKDLEALKKSRKEVLDTADWIIPGHGKSFKNPHRQ